MPDSPEMGGDRAASGVMGQASAARVMRRRDFRAAAVEKAQVEGERPFCNAERRPRRKGGPVLQNRHGMIRFG